MGFFNSKDERVEAIENGLVEVKGNVVALAGDIETENKLLKCTIAELKIEDTNNKKDIDDLKGEVSTLKSHIEKLLSVLEKEESERKQENVIVLETDDMIGEGWYNYKNICKAANVGIQPTALKYSLSEDGVLTKIINHEKNSFKVDLNILSKQKYYVDGHCRIYKGQLLFDETMIQFVIDNAKKIKEDYAKALRKNKEYIDTKNKLESVNFENYREEIKRICNGDTSKYVNGYNALMRKYPDFYKDWSKCKEENKHKPQYKPYGVTKLEYICTFLNEGNYFLKIICELYA